MTGLRPDDDLKACCAQLYECDAVLWLLDGELHPGGERLTLRLASWRASRRVSASSTSPAAAAPPRSYWRAS